MCFENLSKPPPKPTSKWTENRGFSPAIYTKFDGKTGMTLMSEKASKRF